MRIHILSDLHVEFQSFQIPETDADVIVLAGDIHVGNKAIEWITQQAIYKPVIYILGNHEYYGNAYPKLIGSLKGQTVGSNIHILENETLTIDDITFLGCSLWTDFNLFYDRSKAEFHASNQMMDFKKIRRSPQYSKIKTSDIMTVHNKSVAWMNEEFLKSRDTKTVIVTHHAPSILSVSSEYKNDPLSPSFASNLDALVSESKADLWIHGHTHSSADYYIGQTRVVCNPRGYPDEVQAEFNSSFVVEV